MDHGQDSGTGWLMLIYLHRIELEWKICSPSGQFEEQLHIFIERKKIPPKNLKKIPTKDPKQIPQTSKKNQIIKDAFAQVGLKNNCTFCGVFRRQALDRGAMQVDVHITCFQ